MRALALPAIVAALLFLPLIGTRVLFLSDEARYALLARNMLEHGHWLVPHIGDEIHMEKPPGYAWAIAAVALLQGRGITELAAVLPAALSGIAGVVMTVLLGRRLFGPPAARMAGLVLATSFGYLTYARMALADMTITACAIAALWAFWRGSMTLFYVFLAVGLSAKGPYALMPIAVVAVFLVTDGGWRRLRELRLLRGALILGAAVSPWAVAFALQPRHSYVRDVVVGDFGVHFRLWDSAKEILFPLGPLGLEFLPWTIVLPAALIAGARAPDAQTRARFRFLICWALVYVVPVTLSSHKRDRYLLPVFAALALAVGWVITRWHERSDGAARRHAWLMAGLAMAAALALYLPGRPPADAALYMPAGGAAVPASLVLLASAAALLVLVHRTETRRAFTAFALGLALLLAYAIAQYVPRYNEVHDVKRFAHELATRVPPRATIVSFGYARLSIDLYSRRAPLLMRHVTEIQPLLAGANEVYVFAEPRGWRILNEARLGRWDRVAEVHLAGRPVTLARYAR
ncbi:MAG TPA: glycosyltransferase family 39 protein [Terriglobales bacterium]|nr:glycosyltransferase family 39 protein [Terriglobales bacterium]